MSLPKITKETADTLAKLSLEDSQHYLAAIKRLEMSNPTLFQYIDYTLGLITNKYDVKFASEVGSVVGMVIALLEAQDEADELSKQFNMND